MSTSTGQGAISPLFSVIVPVYEDAAGLALCLEALSRQSVGVGRIEVLVVDNGSARPPHAEIAPYPFARLLQEARPGSYNARNKACRVATGEFLAFTDADCRPQPDWLENALHYFREHPDVHAVGGRIQLESSERPSSAELYELAISFRQARFVAEGFAATANLLVRRRVFAAVGPFDGSLMSAGDRDWGYRLGAGGYRMDYLDTAVVIHPARATLAALLKKQRRLAAGFRRVAPPGAPRDAGDRPRGLGMAWLLLRNPAAVGLGTADALRVLVVAGVLIFAGFVERIRLMFGGTPAR